MIDPGAKRALELDLVIDQVRARCATSLGQERVEQIAPLVRPQAALDEATRIAAWLQRLEGGVDLVLTDPGDVRSVIAKLTTAGLSLSADEVGRVGRLLTLSAAVEAFLKPLPAASALAVMRYPGDQLQPLRDEIERTIDESGAVKDSASPRLNDLRSRSRTLASRIDRQVERFYAANRDLPERIVTIREDRTVVAIRSDLNPSKYGFTHARSGSGATFYVEPFGLLELNNEGVSLRDEEVAEVERILRELTQRMRGSRDDLRQIADHIADVDFLRARARLARRLDAGTVELSEDGELDIRDGRHPLLVLKEKRGENNTVPLDLRLEAGEALIITGPNTGGKTVALKTAGIALMSFALGLPIAARRARLPLIRSIVVDLGDPQDIAQSLSTFSGHLRLIARALGDLEPPAVVLLDELGAGTDPREGGALGVAVVEELRRRRVMTLVTSHHEALKGYALATPGVHAAAVEFDEQTLRPTYRLLMDRTGTSNALIIAARLGLPTAVLERAEALVRGEVGHVEQAMTSMEDSARRFDESRVEVEAERASLSAERAVLADRLEVVRAREEELRELERSVRQRLRREAEGRLTVIVDELRAEGARRLEAATTVAPVVDPGRALERGVERVIDKLQREVQRLAVTATRDEEDRPAPTLIPGPIGVGDRVRLRLFGGVEGEVVSLRGETDVEVAALGKRLHARLSDVERLAPVKPKAVAIDTKFHERDAARELNLLGHTVEDAISQVERFLDDAVVARLPEVCIIHGHGSGRLRQGLRDFLQRHPSVATITSDKSGGATVATLDL